MTARRLHAFDSLRATMMLLGLVLHSASNYTTLDGYVYKDPATTLAADAIVSVIHLFRMPVFFVMAGFFTALLVERRGTAEMLRNRFMRVTLVLFAGWLFIIPLTTLSIEFARVHRLNGSGFASVLSAARPGQLWRDNTLHLWFLWFLTLDYAMVGAATFLFRKIGAARVSIIWRTARKCLLSPYCALLLALPLAAAIYLQAGNLATENSFWPRRAVLATYLMFFVIGYATWHSQEILDVWQRRARVHLILALLFIPLALGNEERLAQIPSRPFHIFEAAVVALTISLLVFGICGFALKHANRESPAIRYLTDASYWIYLAHLPLVYIFTGLLSQAALPPLVKMSVVIALTFSLTLASYRYFVRTTFIGAFLNGARNDRPVVDIEVQTRRAA